MKDLNQFKEINIFKKLKNINQFNLIKWVSNNLNHSKLNTQMHLENNTFQNVCISFQSDEGTMEIDERFDCWLEGDCINCFDAFSKIF